MEQTHDSNRCTCPACRRWDDEEVMEITPAGLALLEELAAAARQGETFTNEEVAAWVTGFHGAHRPEPAED